MLAIDYKTGEQIVVYYSVTQQVTWVCSLADWVSEVEVDGEKVARFSLLR